MLRESELSVLGNITPDWIGGLNNTFTYKGFSLNVLLDFVQGGNIVSATKYEMTRKRDRSMDIGRKKDPKQDTLREMLFHPVRQLVTQCHILEFWMALLRLQMPMVMLPVMKKTLRQSGPELLG